MNHDNIIPAQDWQKKLIFYTKRSEINGKIGAAAVISSQNTTIKTYLDPTHYFTVYSSELQEVATALKNTSLSNNQFIRRVTIFTNN